jgi:hypothetical protein
MDDLKNKIKEAKSAGYQDDEIVKYLASMPDLTQSITSAYENQYTPSEILKFLAERKSPAYEAGAKKSELEKGFLTAMQGPTFGFYDELAGALAAPVTAYQTGKPLSEAYQQERDIRRGAAESYMKENPYTSVGLQGAASIPTMLAGLPMRAAGVVSKAVMPTVEFAAPKVAQTVSNIGRYLTAAPEAGKVMGMGQRMVQAGTGGVGYGLLGGAGASEGQTAGEIATDAGKSALMGAVLGPITQPVMGVLGAAGRQVAARVSPERAATYAQQKVAEALLRDTPPDLLESAFGMAQARMGKLGPEARIADVGGANVRQLMDTIATLPGETKQALERAIRERQAGRAGRLVTAADEALGTQGAQFQQSLDAFNAQRKSEARPFYDVIDKATIKVDDSLAALLKRSESLQGPAELLYKTKTGQTLDLANLQKGDFVPMNVLDTLKHSLYDSAQTLKRAGGGQQANAYDDVRKDLITVLTAKSPKVGGQSAYAQAMEKWAGPSQMMDAADLGRKAMTGDIVNFKQELSGLTQSEMDAFRVGALQALRQKTGTEAGQTSLLKMWKEPATQERLKAVFNDDYRQFASAVAKEARLKGLESAGRGSQTAARLAGMEDIGLPAAMAAGQAVSTGNVPGMAAAATNIFNRMGTPEPVRAEMGRLLLSREQQRLIDLGDQIRKMNEARARAAGYGGYTAGQAGRVTSPVIGSGIGNDQFRFLSGQ